jgi:hypothetical protein
LTEFRIQPLQIVVRWDCSTDSNREVAVAAPARAERNVYVEMFHVGQRRKLRWPGGAPQASHDAIRRMRMT